jgi:ADP-ribose pyrophosphatase
MNKQRARLLRSETLLETPIFHVASDWLIDPGGKKIRRFVVAASGAAVVIPVDEKDRVLLVRQYRHPVGESIWELPAGKIDPGETPLQAAKRELKEETGYRARHWKRLVKVHASPGFLKEAMTIYLATGLRAGDAAPSGDEFLELRWFDAAELDAAIRNGRIEDAKTLIGYFLWRRAQ